MTSTSIVRVHTVVGNGMHINRIGHSIIRTPHDSLQLNKILHIPNSSMNLLFVHKLSLKNDVFLEFHMFLFL